VLGTSRDKPHGMEVDGRNKDMTCAIRDNLKKWEIDCVVCLGGGGTQKNASRLPNYGSKMGVDATRKWKAEGFERPWPAMIEMDRTTKAKIDSMWERLGL
jgi:4-hydroxy-3-polyprenylbenzoate decarboxylase